MCAPSQLGEAQKGGGAGWLCLLPSLLTDFWAFPLKKQQAATGTEAVSILGVINHSL